MILAPRDSFGEVRTTKAEFASLGSEAWWMHEKCMSSTDERDYYGKDHADEEAKDPKASDEKEVRFAWE